MNWARRVSAVWAMDARSRDRRSHRSAVLPAPAISVRRVMMRNSEQKDGRPGKRSEEHTSELQSLMRISYAVFCLKKKTTTSKNNYRQDNLLTLQTNNPNVKTTKYNRQNRPQRESSHNI